jgi:hypothetical protein
MRYLNSLFWGSILIILGVLFTLKTAGYITGDVLGWFWPIFLMLLGVWIISGRWTRTWGFSSEGTPFAIDLQGAKQARIKFNHGAGQLEIGSGAHSGQLLLGTSGLGLNYSSELSGDILETHVEAGPTFIPFIGPSSGVWRFQLNRDVPLSLIFEVGACNLTADLTDLIVTYAQLKTGASDSRLNLPEREGNTIVDIEAGAASMDIRIPPTVAARIRVKEGISSLNIDPVRFSRMDGGVYQSSGYDTSTNRAEININVGAGKIEIH